MLVVGVLALVLAVRLFMVWDQLPERVASHFNGAGKVDGWISRSGLLGFTAGEGMLLAVLLATPVWVGAAPGLMNMPHRDYWMAPERRQATVARLGAWMSWLAAGVAVVMVAVNEMIFRANLGEHPGQLPEPAHQIVFWGFLAFVAVYLLLFIRAFRKPPVS